MISNKSSIGLTSMVPETQWINAISPIAELKAIKNDTELKGRVI
jgi:Xaa-Pro aminopeptidase